MLKRPEAILQKNLSFQRQCSAYYEHKWKFNRYNHIITEAADCRKILESDKPYKHLTEYWPPSPIFKEEGDEPSA